MISVISKVSVSNFVPPQSSCMRTTCSFTVHQAMNVGLCREGGSHSERKLQQLPFET